MMQVHFERPGNPVGRVTPVYTLTYRTTDLDLTVNLEICPVNMLQHLSTGLWAVLFSQGPSGRNTSQWPSRQANFEPIADLKWSCCLPSSSQRLEWKYSWSPGTQRKKCPSVSPGRSGRLWSWPWILKLLCDSIQPLSSVVHCQNLLPSQWQSRTPRWGPEEAILIHTTSNRSTICSPSFLHQPCCLISWRQSSPPRDQTGSMPMRALAIGLPVVDPITDPATTTLPRSHPIHCDPGDNQVSLRT